MNRFSPAVLYLSLLLSSAQLFAADTTAPAAPSGPTPAQALAARTAKIECPAFQKIATDYQTKFLAPMQTWSGQHLSKLGTKKLTYVFSGADIVTPLTLFSTADHFTLIADQTPEYTLPQEFSGAQIGKECQTQAYFARYGYFRTNDLEGKDSVKPRFVKMLAYSILMSGGSIGKMEYLSIASNGKLDVRDNPTTVKPDGLRFHVTTADKRAVLVDYLRMNLSNSGLNAEPRLQQFLATHTDGTIFIKSASHLLQKNYFSILAGLITDHAQNVVQDETGLDIELFGKYFQIDSYGKFLRPHPLWHDSPSGVRLRNFLSEKNTLQPLPFTIGYEKTSGSVLLVGTRLQKSAKTN
ncbi:MAG: hypothetical protein RI928_600 [Pseudomonadota bacterium]|jgi:hypothetical protein